MSEPRTTEVQLISEIDSKYKSLVQQIGRMHEVTTIEFVENLEVTSEDTTSEISDDSTEESTKPFIPTKPEKGGDSRHGSGNPIISPPIFREPSKGTELTSKQKKESSKWLNPATKPDKTIEISRIMRQAPHLRYWNMTIKTLTSDTNEVCTVTVTEVSQPEHRGVCLRFVTCGFAAFSVGRDVEFTVGNEAVGETATSNRLFIHKCDEVVHRCGKCSGEQETGTPICTGHQSQLLVITLGNTCKHVDLALVMLSKEPLKSSEYDQKTGNYQMPLDAEQTVVFQKDSHESCFRVSSQLKLKQESSWL